MDGNIDMKQTNERENLINEVCMLLIGKGIPTEEAKNELYMITEKYEITSRCTELAELQQDRNEYLLKKFIIGKTVKGCSQRTIKYYKTQLEQTLNMIGKTVDDIEADDIRYYLAIRQRRDGVSKVTADNELRCLRSFFQYLMQEEFIQKNPVLKVDRIKCERRKKSAFTDIEVEKIRMAAEGEREKMIIEVLLSTGCRVSELCNIRVDEIDGNKVLVHGKGAKDRTVYLNARAELAVQVYLGERRDANPYLLAGGNFENADKKGKGKREMKDWWKNPDTLNEEHLTSGTVEQMMRKIAKRAGVEKANPHKFRRTCATMALRRGMPIEQVSKMLGHEELSTTQIYLDLTEDELEMAHKKYVV